MTKKHFIALADAIREHNRLERELGSISGVENGDSFVPQQLEALADFCGQQNERFNRERWLSYIAGTNGKNGGQIKQG